MVTKSLYEHIRGWLPKDTTVTRAAKAVKPHWRSPAWIALTAVTICALGFGGFTGVQTYIRYSNPQADVTAAYFEKTLNCTQATVGDVVEVTVQVGWHGYVFPEFKRQIQLIDSYPENFALTAGNSTRMYSGYGGSDETRYLLKVVSGVGIIELPKPELYLDNVEITLSGQAPSIQII